MKDALNKLSLEIFTKDAWIFVTRFESEFYAKILYQSWQFNKLSLSTPKPISPSLSIMDS